VNIELFKTPFHYLKINGLFSNEERGKMLEEIFLIKDLKAFSEPSSSLGATDEFGDYKNKNYSIFFDSIYAMRECSNVLSINRKLFSIFDEDELKNSWFFNGNSFNSDSTLVSYYENKDFYQPHRDYSYMTALTWMFKEPKSFTGGVLSFPNYGLDINVDNETTIVFPSNILHSVSEVFMKEEALGKNKGRVCMTQFLIREMAIE